MGVLQVSYLLTCAANASVPETQGRITCSGNELAIMADVNETALAELLKASNPTVFAVRPIDFFQHFIIFILLY